VRTRSWLLALCIAGCGSSSEPAQEPELPILEENDSDEPETADDTPPELMAPSSDPATTCLRVADRLGLCNTQRASALLEHLEPAERTEAEAALADAIAAVETMREQCKGTLDEKESLYVQAMGKCLGLGCTALRDCVGRAP
jgi:hypothetical protein